MIYSNKTTLIFILLLGFTVLACNHDIPDATELTTGDREAIKALFAEWENHAVAGDWEGYAGLFHADAIRKYPGTPDFLENREEIREAAVAMNPSIDHLEFQVVEIDGTRQLAYAMVNVESIVVIDGEEVWDEATGLAIFRTDDDGTWRFYRVLHHSDL